MRQHAYDTRDRESAVTTRTKTLPAQHAANDRGAELAQVTAEPVRGPAITHAAGVVAARDVIEQAKGILMVRHRTTAAPAFDMLVAASRQANLKLVTFAHRLIDESEHPVQGRPAGASGIRFRPAATVAGISGEVDASNVDEVGDYVAGLIHTSSALVLDLTEVQFLSVAGLRLLDSVGEECATTDVDWALISSDAVDLVLRAAGRGYRLPIAGSVAAALDRLTGSTSARCPSPPITRPSLTRC